MEEVNLIERRYYGWNIREEVAFPGNPDSGNNEVETISQFRIRS